MANDENAYELHILRNFLCSTENFSPDSICDPGIIVRGVFSQGWEHKRFHMTAF